MVALYAEICSNFTQDRNSTEIKWAFSLSKTLSIRLLKYIINVTPLHVTKNLFSSTYTQTNLQKSAHGKKRHSLLVLENLNTQVVLGLKKSWLFDGNIR